MTPNQQAVFEKLMSATFYDMNHPGECQPQKIIRRAFISDTQPYHRPAVALLCLYGEAPKREEHKADFVIYTDGLYGKGHWPSDKHFWLTAKEVDAEFVDHIYQLITGKVRG